MQRFGVCFFGACALGKGDSDTPLASTPPHRYLFVIENSRQMQPRAKGVFDAVKSLLDSSLKDQLRPGDTLGVWTFNDALNPTWFPLQEWSPEMKLPLAIRVATFLQPQAYEKHGNMDKALAGMNQVIRASPEITVFLVTSGAGEIRGTSFDKEINASIKPWLEHQEKANMPMVVALRGLEGQVAAWSVAPSPTPVDLQLLSPTQIAQSKPAEPPASNNGQRFSTIPLAASTKERPAVSNTTAAISKPRVEPAIAPVPTNTPNPTPTTVSEIPSTAAPAKAAPQEKAVVAKAPPPVAAPTEKPLAAAPTAKTEPKTIPTAAPELPKKSPEPVVIASAAPTPAVVKPNPAPSPEVKTIAPASTSAVEAKAADSPRIGTLENSFAAVAAPPPPVQKAQPAPVKAEPVLAEEETKQRTQPLPTPAPAQPAPVPRLNSTPDIARAREISETAAPRAESVKSDLPTPPLAIATTAPQESFFRQNAMWLGILLLMGVGAAFCLLKWLRSFSRPQVELLTLPQVSAQAAPPVAALPRGTDLPDPQESEERSIEVPDAAVEVQAGEESEDVQNPSI